MSTTITNQQKPSTTRHQRILDAVEHAAHLLPAQGPIKAFVHHNTLHSFEDLPFEQAVLQGAGTFGCQPYLRTDQYRQLLKEERIQVVDLRTVLQESAGESIAEAVLGQTTRLDLQLAMLEAHLQFASGSELRWFIAETDALERFHYQSHRERMIEHAQRWVLRDLQNGRSSHGLDRDLHETALQTLQQFDLAQIERWNEAAWEACTLRLLWAVCRKSAADIALPRRGSDGYKRPRDLLLAATGEDADRPVHELLIRYCAAFLDQGFAAWQLPVRDRGFYDGFITLYAQPGGQPGGLPGLREELQRLRAAGMEPIESIAESLELLGVPPGQWQDCITSTLLALRGWAGMIWQMESRADRAVHPARPGSLLEFLAIRLVVDRLSLAGAAKSVLGYRGALAELPAQLATPEPRRDQPSHRQRAFLVFQLAQVLGWDLEMLFGLKHAERSQLVNEIESFSDLEQRRVFHLAYERQYRVRTLDAVAAHARRVPPPARAKAAVVCCLDEREESFRRHLEEVAPWVETFGAAGFFGVAMYYQGVGDAHFTPLCPVVIRPRHYVREYVVYTFEESYQRRKVTQRAIGTASHRAHLGSRSFALGAFLSTVLGPLASIPLIARTLLPRLTSQTRKLAGGLVSSPLVTQLLLERSEETPGKEEGRVGYLLEEMGEIVHRLLCDIGLTTDLPPLIVITGHGSSSLNNPHESAHDCGACAGARGGPNARAFARMANDPRVRELLERRGLKLSSDVWFVGAYHNTCDDSVTYFDLERLPVSHRDPFDATRRVIDEARERSAHERCRRFASAPLHLSPEAALRHVENRAEDLAQTRPEYGHATNSLCIVGRRGRTRGLFLDRRAFLTSYDPTQDDDKHTILARILAAAVPVCAGINLEYYFSYTDPTGWGCGTKLPHNITSLLGVMDGAASDLRPGLPWQMVEIHEPVRLMFVIETFPQALLDIMEQDETVRRLCQNEWVQLAALDPDSPAIQLYRNGKFELYEPDSEELPSVPSSLDWYRGWRNHLGYASVVAPTNGKCVT